MTELEGILLKALSELSRQYDEEQRRQSELISGLSRQVDGLARQLREEARVCGRLTRLLEESSRR